MGKVFIASNLKMGMFQNAVIGDSHPMGVAAQIFNDTESVLEGWLAVDDSLLLVAVIRQYLKRCGISNLNAQFRKMASIH
jgi:hypothetical protein